VAAGISVIPIAADGSKAPCWQLLPRRPGADGEPSKATWKPFQTRLPTRTELVDWFKPDGAECLCGIAVVCGAGSGGWETIDFDEIELGYHWWQCMRKAHPRILAKLLPVITPRPGLHVHYRSGGAGSGRKLARGFRVDPETKENELKTLIETRGEGNYIIVPPSPGACHSSGRPYELMDGRDLSEVQAIAPEEREILISAAEDLNEYVRPARPRPPVRPPSATKAFGAGRPGDDFNARASWAEILEPHGWTFLSELGDGTQYWQRPGKNGSSASATVNYEDSDLLFVFSTNAGPFEESRSYNKFSAFTVLSHAGDFKAAAQALRRMGYGRPIPRAIADPYRCYGQFVPRRNGSTR
jgi:putative DNA primase/helicase